MAEQSKPNTFGGGMVTDLDPGFQPKDTYFHGLNVRVITNGDNSYTLEPVKGAVTVKEINYNSVAETYLSGDDRYRIHGATVLESSIITFEKEIKSTSPNWRIQVYNINTDGEISGSSQKWSGIGLFDDNAGVVEVEAIAETESIHRVYATDGITGLKSINIKDSEIASSNVNDFEAFKPNLLSGVTLSNYKESGGVLKYGSYSYVYRLSSSNQSNYTDWSNISRPIKIVKGSLVDENSLGIEGGSSSDNSSASLDLTISNLNQDYDRIEIAAIHYPAKDVSTISIIEEGTITTDTYNFTHSGLEAEKIVEGGISDVIISNKTWNVCKSLTQKDNKLFAGNLKHETEEIDSIISGYGKLISYKAIGGSSSWETTGNLTGHSSSVLNPDRHKVGGPNNHHWSPDEAEDKAIYKFINANFGDNPSTSPEFVLGAETDGYSNGDNGFRLTFSIQSYYLDDHFHSTPDGTNGVQDCTEIYQLNSSFNENSWLGGKPGPHNPKWDFEYRSFKRGECYRFGIVFYDLLGVPGFTHHLGDIKMPDALDSNINVLNANGDDCSEHALSFSNYNNTWAPFNEGITNEHVMANALIPRLDIRLPSTVTSKISGYKIVRAEIKENDRTILTQGLLSHIVNHSAANVSSNATLADKFHAQEVPYYFSVFAQADDSPIRSNPIRVDTTQSPNYTNTYGWSIETPDVTLGGESYNINNGYLLKPVCLMEMNVNEDITLGSSYHSYLGSGNWGDSTPNEDNGHSGMRYMKYKPWQGHVGGSVDDTIRLQFKNTDNDEYFFRQAEPITFCKSVVSGEEVGVSASGLRKSYIHYTGQFSDTNTHPQFDDTFAISVGGIQPRYSNMGSQAAWYGGAVPSLLTVTSSSITLPGFYKRDDGTTVTTESWNDYPITNQPNEAQDSFATSGPGSDEKYQYVSYKWVAEVVRDTSTGFEQYGGSNQSALENTRFIDCTPFQSVNSTSNITTKVFITGGDTYCDNVIYKNSWNDNAEAAEQTMHFSSVVPLETKKNYSLRQGVYMGSSAQVSNLVEDNYLFNTAYGQEHNYKSSVVKPTDFNENNTFASKIAASQTKLVGEPLDSWAVFPSNDFIELDLSNGAIHDLINYKNNIYAVQESGISLLSINPRALISGEGAAADIQIVTGTGTVIERYDYLTTSYGANSYNTSIVSPTGFYVFDSERSEIIKCDGQNITPLALSNSYKSWIERWTKNVAIPYYPNHKGLGDVENGLYTGYDSQFRECYFTINPYDGYRVEFAISDLDGKLISERDAKLRALPDYKIIKYIPYRNRCYAVYQEADVNQGDVISLMNEGDYQSFSVRYFVNDNPQVNKVFDTSEILSSTTDSTLFTQHQVYTNLNEPADNYYNSGDIIHSPTTTQERYREGVRRLPLRSLTSNRYRGIWLQHKIIFTQENGDYASNVVDPSTDKKIDIFAINTRYRQSR